jgi:hypothetical protein
MGGQRKLVPRRDDAAWLKGRDNLQGKGGGGYIPFERGFARFPVPEVSHLSEARDIRFIALRSVE